MGANNTRGVSGSNFIPSPALVRFIKAGSISRQRDLGNKGQSLLTNLLSLPKVKSRNLVQLVRSNGRFGSQISEPVGSPIQGRNQGTLTLARDLQVVANGGP